MTNIDQQSVNAVRILAADQIQKANSGHPGAPLGTAPMMYELFANHLAHNPANPNWANRDRFILSGGHGSAGYYALLYLFGYGLTQDDLKNFRQLHSLTPGHPEYGHTAGVECTTGPLGSGLASAVGMAIAEQHLASEFNKPGFPLVDHYTFVEVGDGDLMEGISQEALSLAGTLELDKLILLYDSNKISIEGDTDAVFREDMSKRMEALGFSTWTIEDGNDIEAIAKAIEEAKADTKHPSFITVKTKIGYGSPKEGSASSHGEPLGVENVAALRENLLWPSKEDFFVPQEVHDNFAALAEKLAEKEAAWQEMADEYFEKYPEMKEHWEKMHQQTPDRDLLEDEDFWTVSEKPEATRVSSGKMINKLKDIFPNMMGGSADLGPSNKTYMDGKGDFSAEDRSGRNLHFGVRELAMAGIANGLALSGMKPYVGTFFVFSDYSKPMARLAALMNLPVTYVFSHDSIGVGEDGPTHQPVEHLASYRNIPNMVVFRPADAMETAAGWYIAANAKDHPTALILTRQNVEQLKGTGKEAINGGYILSDSNAEIPQAIIMASGSETGIALKAKDILAKEGYDVRVVSMPSLELFEQQPAEYKEAILPRACQKRVAVEASHDYGWGRYTGIDGKIIGMESFGTSAPGSLLFDYYGFTPERVAKEVKELLAEE